MLYLARYVSYIVKGIIEILMLNIINYYMVIPLKNRKYYLFNGFAGKFINKFMNLTIKEKKKNKMKMKMKNLIKYYNKY